MLKTNCTACEPSPEDVTRLEEIIDRFEDAWQRGERPAPDAYLPAGDSQRFTLLVELVHVDLENRFKAGEAVCIEEYLQRYPELSQDRAVVLELLRAEWEFRQRRDGTVPVNEYLDRFPGYRDELLMTETVTLPSSTPAPRHDKAPTECQPGGPGAVGAGGPDAAGTLVTRSRYRVLRLHARGGLGEVLAARDDELNREVALKRLQQQHARSPDSQHRFLREAEITSQLEHPGVVPVYGLGRAGDGSLCYAMRFIQGDTFQEAAEHFHQAGNPARTPAQRSLAFRQLLGRFVSVCYTVAYAHSRGILHRDLKPGNILLGSFGETLVVDWGLARQAGKAEVPVADAGGAAASDLTQDGVIIGTPAFMSPEQAAGRWDLVGTASDVYSLGATLYVVLTGQPPFGPCDVQEVLDRVRRADFPRPRQVNKEISPALQAVCLKAMALRPEDRYPTPLALGADLEHWLAGESVSAWREPLRVRARRWLARHPTLVTATVLSLVAAAGLAVLTSLWMAAADRQRVAEDREQLAQELADARRKELDRADRESYYYHIAAADRDWWADRFDRTHQRLAECKPELRRWEWNHLTRRLQDGLHVLRGHTKEVWCVVYSPDGKRLASASLDGTIKVWDATAGRELMHLRGHDGEVRGVAFSPDSRTLVSGSRDRSVRLWDAATGAEMASFRNLPGEVNGVAFSPNGKRVAAALGSRDPAGKVVLPGEVRLWEVATGKQTAALRLPAPATSVAFSPDDKILAAGSRNWKIRLWDTASAKMLADLEGHQAPVQTVAFSPNGKLLASAGNDGIIRLWDVATRKERAALAGHFAPAWGVAFSPDGSRLASSADDQTVRVWDVELGRALLTLHGHTQGIASVAYSPDGSQLASASDDETVRLWDATASKSSFTLLGHRGAAGALTYCPDGRRIAATGADRTILVWDVATRRVLLTLSVPADSEAVAFSPDGKRLAAAVDDKTVRIWDATSGREERILRGHGAEVRGVAFSPNGRWLASASWDRTVKLWDVGSGNERCTLAGHDDKVQAVAFSPDGQQLASAGDDKAVKIWDVATGKQTLSLDRHAAAVACIAFSPDGRRLAAGTVVSERVVTMKPSELTLWDLASGQAIHTLQGHLGSVNALAFSPDGQRLASVSDDRRLKLWEPTSGQEIITLFGQVNSINGVVFSPDGRQLASSSSDGTIVVWNGAPPEAAENP